MTSDAEIVERLKARHARLLHAAECAGLGTLPGRVLLDQAAEVKEGSESITRLSARVEELEQALNQSLGIMVEFGDLNGFRNMSNAELGKTLISSCEHIASLLSPSTNLKE